MPLPPTLRSSFAGKLKDAPRPASRGTATLYSRSNGLAIVERRSPSRLQRCLSALIAQEAESGSSKGHRGRRGLTGSVAAARPPCLSLILPRLPLSRLLPLIAVVELLAVAWLSEETRGSV